MKPIIYTTDRCPFCSKVKRILEDNNVEYEEIDVQDSGVAEELQSKSGHIGLPQLYINKEYIIGYNRPEIEKQINKLKNKSYEVGLNGFIK